MASKSVLTLDLTQDAVLIGGLWRKAAVAYANGLNQARGGGAWPLTVGSRDINASVACANIGAFVAAAFIPAEKAAVASVTIVT
jgi:hypothetical protein